jgi:Carboxypeptidase regulatory-like domain/TonB-dependent Receptor Plug Domain
VRVCRGGGTMFAAVGLLIGASAAEAQSALRVRVTDKQSGMPVRAALVSLDGQGQQRSVSTDSAGWAALPLTRAGLYNIAVAATAYLESRVQVNFAGQQIQPVEVQLAPDPIRLPSVMSERATRVARLERVGFYNRMRESHGIFIDEDAIEKRNQRRVSDHLQAVPGIRMVPGSFGEMSVWFQGNARPGSGGTIIRCGPRVFLDGVELGDSDSRKPTPIDNIVPAYDLMGIEIYRRPSEIPARFGGAMSGCGVILLWSK